MEHWSLVGETAALAAAMIWALSMTLYSRFGVGIRARHLNLFKISLALILLGLSACAFSWHWPDSLQTILILALSGLVGLALGDTLLFVAMQEMGVQRNSVIQCLSPAFAALMAWAFFGERLNYWEWLGLGITTFFLALLLRSRGAHNETIKLTRLGLTASLGAALCQGFAMTSLRWSLQSGDVFAGTFLRMAPSALVLWLFVVLRKEGPELKAIARPRRRLYFLSLAAFLGTFIGLLLMSVGAKYAKAGVATALASTTPIWILPVARIFLGERLTAKLLFLTLAAVSGVMIMILGPYLH